MICVPTLAILFFQSYFLICLWVRNSCVYGRDIKCCNAIAWWGSHWLYVLKQIFNLFFSQSTSDYHHPFISEWLCSPAFTSDKIYVHKLAGPGDITVCKDTCIFGNGWRICNSRNWHLITPGYIVHYSGGTCKSFSSFVFNKKSLKILKG